MDIGRTKISLLLLDINSQSVELNVLLSWRHQTRVDNNDRHAFNQCSPRPLRRPLELDDHRGGTS